jgi:hypothetical protein
VSNGSPPGAGKMFGQKMVKLHHSLEFMNEEQQKRVEPA